MKWLSALAILVAFAATATADGPLDGVPAALKAGDTAKALKLAEEAVAAEPKNPRAYFARGMVQLALRDFDKAVADFTKTIALDPKAANAYDQRGTAEFKRGKVRESLADFDRAIELRPETASAHWRRGLTLYYAEKFADGVAQFTTSDVSEPNDVENAVWHFLCNARVKGLDKARGEFLKVERDPRGAYMMKIYEMFKGTAKPEDVFAAAEAGTVTDDARKEQRFYANYYVSMFLEATGEPKKSLEYMKTATEKYPIGHYMMDVARVHLGMRTPK